MSLQDLVREVENLVISRKGGSGSGNFGHGGRKGQRGGSSSKGGTGGAMGALPSPSSLKKMSNSQIDAAFENTMKVAKASSNSVLKKLGFSPNERNEGTIESAKTTFGRKEIVDKLKKAGWTVDLDQPRYTKAYHTTSQGEYKLSTMLDIASDGRYSTLESTNFWDLAG